MSHYKLSMSEEHLGLKVGEKRSIRAKGKTARDHKSGAHLRCIHNKQTRADWQNDSRRPAFSTIAHTCNGKRNRNPSADSI